MTDWGYEVIFEAGNGLEMINAYQSHYLRPDLIILDINMPVMNGIETAKWLRNNHPKTHILICSMSDSFDLIKQSLEVGAKGFVSKTSELNEIREAIDSIYLGHPFISKMAFSSLVHGFHAYENDYSNQLTDREVQILDMICQEYTLKQIADYLVFSTRTIEMIRNKIMEKLQVKSTAGMVVMAIKLGYFSIDRFPDPKINKPIS